MNLDQYSDEFLTFAFWFAIILIAAGIQALLALWDMKRSSR